MMGNQTLVADPVLPQDPTKNILASGLYNYNYFGDRTTGVVDSPEMITEDDGVVGDVPSSDRDRKEREGDAYDYFGGPDLGGDYTERRSHTTRRKRGETW